MVHLGSSSNDIWHSYFDGNKWTKNVKIPGQSSKASPALAVCGGKLHMVHLGSSSNDIWWSTSDGEKWTENVKIPDQSSKASPALAPWGHFLHMVHLGDSSNKIWHSYFDPDYVRPRYELFVSEPIVEKRENGQYVTARGGVRATGTDPEPARVKLRLREDVTGFDRNLAEKSSSGTDVTIDLEYKCPAEPDDAGGPMQVFAEVIRGDSKKQSGRTTVEECPPKDDRPPPQPATFSELHLFNCSTDRRTVHIWRKDLASGGAWESLGTQGHQYDESGNCPPIGAAPFRVELPVDGHVYLVRAIDPELTGCTGNDPDAGACARFSTKLQANSMSGPAVATIS
jgi:hypothetical protein